jgi:hypothetical protein
LSLVCAMPDVVAANSAADAANAIVNFFNT